ncbi:MAG: GMP synthase (glutamine-hydrolyzing) [Polyangiales bacterium]|jgi:GMP synthase (glutamine-hydrolysing)
MRVAIVDAFSRQGRISLAAAGCTPAGELYARVAASHEPGYEYVVLLADAASRVLPDAVAAGDFDAVIWTGSELTIHHDDEEVRAQLELARTLLRAGVRNFGSCWAAQLAVAVCGGTCEPSPRGREFGIARGIALTHAGAAHPMYRGKPRVFCSYASHEDEITKMPADAVLLAGNAWSDVQALEVRVGEGVFTALQYHPEYNLYELARLGGVRGPQLVQQGIYDSQEEADAYFAKIDSLHESGDADLAKELGIAEDLLDANIRQREIANWLASLPR